MSKFVLLLHLLDEYTREDWIKKFVFYRIDWKSEEELKERYKELYKKVGVKVLSGHLILKADE